MAVPLTVGSLALVGCGSSGSSGGSSGSAKKATYTIAYQGPLSGDNAQLGINMDNGVKLALDQANKKGDLPFTLKFADSDDMGTPDQGPTAAQKLIDNKSVVAVIGPAFSGATKAAEPQFSQANLVSISPSATNPKLTSLGFSTFFRVVPPDNAQGQEAAAFMAKKLSAKKVYSVDDKSEYGTGLSGVIESSLKQANVTIVHDGIPPTKDYGAEAQKISGAGVDTVYYSGYFADFALLVKALKGANFSGNILSGDGSNDDQLVKLAGQSAEGVYLTCPCNDANVDPKAASFTTAYKSMFNINPGTYSPEAFDAANAVIAAMRGVKGSLTRESVAKAVKTVDYTGLTKEIKFESNGEVAGKVIYVYQVKNGKREVLGTTLELDKS